MAAFISFSLCFSNSLETLSDSGNRSQDGISLIHRSTFYFCVVWVGKPGRCYNNLRPGLATPSGRVSGKQTTDGSHARCQPNSQTLLSLEKLKEILREAMISLLDKIKDLPNAG